MFDKTVSVYSRNPETDELKHQTTIRVWHAVDNLKFDHETGNIYAGTANSLFGWLMLFPPTGKHVSSNYGGVTELTRILVNGEEYKWALRDLVVTNRLNGISGGLKMSDQLIVGSFMDDGYLVCPFTWDIQPELTKMKPLSR